MEVDVVPEQQQKEADYVIELCESGKTPTCAAVVSGRPNSDGFAKYAKQFKGSKYVKGIRQVLHVKDTPAGYCLDEKFVKGIQLLGELGLSFDLCVRPGGAAGLREARRPVPGHAVHPRPLRQRRASSTRPPSASSGRRTWPRSRSGRTSSARCAGSSPSAPARGKWTLDDLAPVVNHTLDAFGPDRVMFGGDWPVCLLGVEKYADWATALQDDREGPARGAAEEAVPRQRGEVLRAVTSGLHSGAFSAMSGVNGSPRR